MNKHHYEVAKEAFAILQFYSDHYASSLEYQKELQDVLKILKEKAEVYPQGSRGRSFLLAFADALAYENKPGDYKSPLS